MVEYLFIFILLIYSAIMTYLYVREKSKNDRESGSLEGDVDIKIQEIGNRLEEIKRESEQTKIDLEDEDW